MGRAKKETEPREKLHSYAIAIPITGVCYVTVQATNEEDAIEKAFENMPREPDEWEGHRRICSGNVLHASLNEIDVVDEGEIEDE